MNNLSLNWLKYTVWALGEYQSQAGINKAKVKVRSRTLGHLQIRKLEKNNGNPRRL